MVVLKKPNLRPGIRVRERAKPQREGVLVATDREDGKKHQWIVEFDQPDGSKSKEKKTSRQLATIQADNQPTNINPVALPIAPVAPPVAPVVVPPPAPVVVPPVLTAPPSPIVTTVHEEPSSPNVSVSSNSTATHERGPDEDALPFLPSDDMEILGPAGMETASTGIEEDEPLTEDVRTDDDFDLETEEEHKRRRAEYELEKEQLLKDGWTVFKETEKPPTKVGCRVHTRAKQPLYGTVVGKNEAAKKWIVLWDGYDDTEERSPQGLTQDFDCETYEWKLVEHSDPVEDDFMEQHEFPEAGLTYFDFDQFNADRISKANPAYEFPYLKLFQKLWPGNWKFQCKQMNDRVDVVNQDAKKKNPKKPKIIRKVTHREWWVFIGLLLVAAAHGIGGEKLWEKARPMWTASQPVNYGVGGFEVMSESRFNDMKSVFPHSFQDKKAEEEEDPWHMIRGMLDGFNLVRSLWVASSIKKVLDESMSAWRPRTTRFGGLPHLSFISRKPEPLGTEFKTIACTKTGIMLYVEIQEGKNLMKTKRYGGSQQSCTFRLSEGASHTGQKWPSRKTAKDVNKAEYFLGDSWFTNVPVAEWMSERGHAYVGALKNMHRLFPRHELEKKMEDWVSGSSLVMECLTPNGHSLLAIGYKYNKRKVLLFLATKNAGSTRPGAPYVAKFPDSVGNVCYREVERPAIISEYFAESNMIDAHNHARQGELKLEKRWVTHDCWFRLDTTFIGMTVTDCWKAFKHHVADKKEKAISVTHFADRLASDCLRNKLSDTYREEDNLNMMSSSGTAPMLAIDVPVAGDASQGVSPLSVATTLNDFAEAHRKMKNPDLMADGRPKRRTCRVDACKKEIHWMCGNDSCRSFKSNPNGRLSRGMFYCDAHWPMEHLKDLQEIGLCFPASN